MPFADYDDFDACVAANSDKSDPEAYCAAIKRQVEGKSEAWDALDFGRKAAVLADHGEDILSMDDTGQKSAAAIATGKQAPLKPKAVPDVDPQNPPEEFADALDAEDFIIYGKASIEKFDEGGEKSGTPEVLDMDALEAALDRFFASEKAPGIISIGHDDIPVGRPLESYDLDDDAAIEVGGDTYEFDAGDTITTHVEDADGDDRPELWLVGDLAKDTEIARKARLGVLMGELDGYSVTFGRKAVTPEGSGRRVTDLDLFSVTLAPDDMVANKGAEFDLAGFKAAMNRYLPTARGDDATHALLDVAEQLARTFDSTMSTNTDDTDAPPDADTLLQKVGEKLTGGASDDADDSTDTGDADDAGQKQPDDDDGDEGDGDAVDELMNALADEMGVPVEDLHERLQGSGQEADDEPDPDDDEDEEDDEADMKSVSIDFGAKAEEHGLVTEEELGEKLDELQESIVDDLGQKLADTNEEAVEEIAQKMATGSTPNPAGGSFQDAEDFEAALNEVADKEGW